jgi:RimJ/RimL family protein N-acetyltransferase
MTGPIFLEGKRVTLRPIEREDLDFEVRHRNNPRIRRPLTLPTPVNREQAESRFERHTESDDGISLWVCADEQRVGKIILFDMNETHGTSEIAYWLVPDVWGNGYASEAVSLFIEYAFAERRLHKVSAHVLVENEPSQAVLERVGFEREGHLRDARYVEGEHRDVFRYGLLATDWD